MDRWGMRSGQCGSPWTTHCEGIIAAEIYTMTIIKPNDLRVPREHCYHPRQVITLLSENKAFRGALFCPDQLPSSDSDRSLF